MLLVVRGAAYYAAPVGEVNGGSHEGGQGGDRGRGKPGVIYPALICTMGATCARIALFTQWHVRKDPETLCACSIRRILLPKTHIATGIEGGYCAGQGEAAICH